jgi:hypothetical protein
MDKHPSEKDLEKFMLEVSKLNAIEFLGLAKIFNISLFEDEEGKKARSFENILSEVLDKYITLSRRQRRSIMKIIKSSNLGKIEE